MGACTGQSSLPGTMGWTCTSTRSRPTLSAACGRCEERDKFSPATSSSELPRSSSRSRQSCTSKTSETRPSDRPCTCNQEKLRRPRRNGIFKNTHHVRNVRGSSLTLLPPSSRSLDTRMLHLVRAIAHASVLASWRAPRGGLASGRGGSSFACKLKLERQWRE